MSMFYTAEFNRKFPVTLLLLERISACFGEDAKGMPDSEVNPLLCKCLQECRIVDSPSKADIDYLMDRLTKMIEKDKAEGTPAELPTKSTFASSYALWAHDLDTDQVCLLAAGYDYFLARRMYQELDKEDVTEVALQFLSREWEKIKVSYESVVYGFGGSYKGDKGGGDGGGDGGSGGDSETTNVVDLTEKGRSREAMAVLKKMGF